MQFGVIGRMFGSLYVLKEPSQDEFFFCTCRNEIKTIAVVIVSIIDIIIDIAELVFDNHLV